MTITNNDNRLRADLAQRLSAASAAAAEAADIDAAIASVNAASTSASRPNHPGIFITFEGGEGAGKSTQIRLLQARLQYAGYQVLIMREPGGTRIGEQIRRILLDATNTDLTATSELLLYEAARAQLVIEVIRPQLARGKVVLCDRFADSTFAYQSQARGLSAALVDAANAIGTDGLVPDRTILLEQNIVDGLLKATEDGADRLESESLDFHQLVHDGFEILANTHPQRIFRISLQADKSQTAELVFERLSDLFDAPAARDFVITEQLLALVKESK